MSFRVLDKKILLHVLKLICLQGWTNNDTEIQAVIYGAAGHHQNQVSKENVKASLKIIAGQGTPFGLAMTSSKWSICLLYKRIFVLRPFRIVTYLVMAVIFCWGVLASTVTWCFCVPIAYGWDKSIAGGDCANREVGYLIVAVIDAVTDFIILLLPLPMIWQLQIPRQKQISLVVILSIALLSIIASAIRAYGASKLNFEDFTESRTLIDVFSAIEPATSIIVASSLVLQPVVKRWVGGGFITTPKPASGAKRDFQRIDMFRDKAVFGSTPDDIELCGTATLIERADLAANSTRNVPPQGVHCSTRTDPLKKKHQG
ncbi:MAG: hypothetical protein Q9213_005254 [Squamulea squamosa]